MNGLLEFVFEGVPPNQLAHMVMDCIRKEENVSDASRDGVDLPLDVVLDPLYWSAIISSAEDVACIVNLRILKIHGKAIERVTLQIIHYGDVNDMSVLFSSTDCKKAGISASEEMYQWAKGLSEKYGVINFFGGLEPAADEGSQLFSKHRFK